MARLPPFQGANLRSPVVVYLLRELAQTGIRPHKILHGLQVVSDNANIDSFEYSNVVNNLTVASLNLLGQLLPNANVSTLSKLAREYVQQNEATVNSSRDAQVFKQVVIHAHHVWSIVQHLLGKQGIPKAIRASVDRHFELLNYIVGRQPSARKPEIEKPALQTQKPRPPRETHTKKTPKPIHHATTAFPVPGDGGVIHSGTHPGGVSDVLDKRTEELIEEYKEYTETIL